MSRLRNLKRETKGRKWKFQARNQLSKRDRIANPPGTKRPRNENDEPSLEKKRSKGMSQFYPLTNNIQTHSPSINLKLSWEQLENIIAEDATAMEEDISVGLS